MAYNVRKMDRVQRDLQAGSKARAKTAAGLRKKDGDGSNGTPPPRKPLFGKKDGGTRVGNLLRTIGSVFNKKEEQTEAVVESTDPNTTAGTGDAGSTITPNGESKPLIKKESSDKKLYTDLPEKDRAAARQYNMDTYGSHTPTDDAKALNISKEELARRYAASQE